MLLSSGRLTDMHMVPAALKTGRKVHCVLCGHRLVQLAQMLQTLHVSLCGWHIDVDPLLMTCNQLCVILLLQD